MAKYIFAYNAEYKKFTPDQVRTEVIKFLHKQGAKTIFQCLETTYIFEGNGKLTTDQWYKAIEDQLDGEDHVLENGFYLLSKVSYGVVYELRKKCNRSLQDFVEKTLKEI